MKDWKESGLKLPSVIRVHKITTLEKDLVEKTLGAMSVEAMSVTKCLYAFMNPTIKICIFDKKSESAYYGQRDTVETEV